MKSQKLVRKYRFLKPNERIQYGDYRFGNYKPIITANFYKDNYLCEDADSTLIGTCPIGGEFVVRFVDCVPAK